MTSSPTLKQLHNGEAVPLAELPHLSNRDFAAALRDGVTAGQRVSALFGTMQPGTEAIRVYLVLADDVQHRLFAGTTDIEGGSYPSLTPACPQVHMFERELAEQFGLRAVGHPWFKPVRYCRSWNGRDAWDRPGDQELPPAVGDFYRVEGEEVHEVAVGPVHAGVIEPGHFRFQCGGEQVYHLEIALGYQHRGIEEALIGGPGTRTRSLIETIAGDATVAHTTAYGMLVEALTGVEAPPRAQAIRGIALELERLACHIGDLGALAGDIGYLPTASFCGRIRGDFLNMTALLCGNRFGRGLVRPGGVGFDLESARADKLRHALAAGEKDATTAIRLLWETQSVLARFEEVGAVSAAVAIELGLVGPAARASGLARDIRHDQPAGIFRKERPRCVTCPTGDVQARAYVRWLEIQQSLTFIRTQISLMPEEGPLHVATGPLAPDSFAVAMTESWRGEVCHAVITDGEGRLARYKVVDPSFHNWPGLAQALRNQAISDFPICNKSFNLSYCGHDL